METVISLKAREAFILNLKFLMEVHQLSYSDLASKMNSTKQRVSNIFNRDTWVSIDTIHELSKAFKIEETDLFDPNFQDRYKKKTK